jgi:hypothetical protein
MALARLELKVSPSLALASKAVTAARAERDRAKEEWTASARVDREAESHRPSEETKRLAGILEQAEQKLGAARGKLRIEREAYTARFAVDVAPNLAEAREIIAEALVILEDAVSVVGDIATFATENGLSAPPIAQNAAGMFGSIAAIRRATMEG